MAAEERIWECEFRLAENENGRLRIEVEKLKTELCTLQEENVTTAQNQKLETKYLRTLERAVTLEKELEVALDCKDCKAWKQKTESLANKYFQIIKNMRIEIKNLRKDTQSQVE